MEPYVCFVLFFFHSLSVSVLHSDFVAVVCVCSVKQQMKANATLTALSKIRLWFALSSQNPKHHLLSLVSNIHDIAGLLSLSGSSL